MNNYPEFSPQGYEIISELGHNFTGGRVTYLANKLTTKQKVVIKQFQFAQLDSNWAEYQAHEQEIKLLQHLNHPGIPRYLDSFQTEAGFCMVQEYKNAQSLASISRNWKPQEIKQIALSVLEILIYLQAQKPSVIHRDIKPENILIDEENKIYLVDFGFARSGGGEVAVSSVVKGSMGFMPPEQLFNRELTLASDLYGLGATLICLLTGTKSADIGSLVDANYQIHFRHLIPPQERGWLNWLEKMVEPNTNERYQSAKTAFTALVKINVNQLPKVRLSSNSIDLTAGEFREKVAATVTITNPIPNTILSGKWEVAPHPSDPPHTPYDHSWISFDTHKFEGNQVECKIIADTSKLLAEKTYQRQIILHTNSEPETHTINIQVETASQPKPQKMHYWSIGLLCASYPILSLLVINLGWLNSVPELSLRWFVVPITIILVFPALDTTINATATHKDVNELGSVLGVLLGGIFGLFFSSLTILLFSIGNSDLKIFLTTLIVLGGLLLGSEAGNYPSKKDNNLRDNEGGKGSIGNFVAVRLSFLIFQIFVIILDFVFLGLSCLFKSVVFQQIKRGIPGQNAANVTLLSAGVSLSLGIWLVVIYQFGQFLLNTPAKIQVSFYLIVGLIWGFASLVVMLYLLVNQAIIQPRKVNKLIAEYHQNEEQLIKP
ncbi:MAG: serine/threonine protein kinase [Gomphosphaeria aponina SAG 52.96 = DSM 107014]|uniref:non-specific serine/threonine protein kinase n=1 Tax=Gomphosphaeria aponina SAG 52.96 = DSM 107014 TaxID=1521640 RepID=A0A941GUY7_9CHRO|nr:serine/threonine protein kinase [Gomphosphaeria aponina SAG 52.96 = DSM 107014]